MKNGDKRAYPNTKFVDENGYWELGLTKREYFAAMAMQGIMNNSVPKSYEQTQVISFWAVKQADALLKTLEE